jgi:hypothetical protein
MAERQQRERVAETRNEETAASASSRKGTNPLMHSSDGPPCDGGAGGRPNAEPVRGAAPAVGNAPGALMTAAVTAPLTGGKAGSLAGNDALGSGAGNAPCALTSAT